MNPINSLTKQFKPISTGYKSHLDALSILIVAIIKRRTVNWAELATTSFTKTENFPFEALFSRIRYLKKKPWLKKFAPERGLDAQHGSYQLDVWQVQNQHPIPCHQLQRHGYPYTLDTTAQKWVLKHSGENRSVGGFEKIFPASACEETVG